MSRNDDSTATLTKSRKPPCQLSGNQCGQAQGGYDRGVLAFAVGYGGSITWFGSSAGVAISNEFEQAKDSVRWLKEGWHVAAAYVLGMGIFYLALGWEPDPPLAR
ncbi:MAG TPA: hypothetical protein VEP67_00195 [Thiobacillaceae bacterium]|nr:hypothetical protein [Thiobacillaceae bacterium]